MLVCSPLKADVRRRITGKRSLAGIETKKPAADFSARAIRTLFDHATLPVICPTCQTVSDLPI